MNFRLYKTLAKQGIKHGRMAKDLNFSPSFLSKILHEERRPSKEIAKKIADYLNKPFSFLFDPDDFRR
jgi:transcriptional regulator with XRE-family HTH domain